MDSIKALVMECLELYYYYIIKKWLQKESQGRSIKGTWHFREMQIKLAL